MKFLRHKTTGRVLEWTPHLARCAELEPVDDEAPAPLIVEEKPDTMPVEIPAEPEAPKAAPTKTRRKKESAAVAAPDPFNVLFGQESLNESQTPDAGEAGQEG